MRFSLAIAALAALVVPTFAQTPACYTLCVETAVTVYPGTCDPLDTGCQCNDSYFNNVMSNCFASYCPSLDSNDYTYAVAAWAYTCSEAVPWSD